MGVLERLRRLETIQRRKEAGTCPLWVVADLPSLDFIGYFTDCQRIPEDLQPVESGRLPRKCPVCRRRVALRTITTNELEFIKPEREPVHDGV